jgi:hypothetical protein
VLASAANEMNASPVCTAHSRLIFEAQNCRVSLSNNQGQLLDQPAALPVLPKNLAEAAKIAGRRGVSNQLNSEAHRTLTRIVRLMPGTTTCVLTDGRRKGDTHALRLHWTDPTR